MSDCKYECPVCDVKLFVFSDGSGDWLEQFDEAQPNKLATAIARAESLEKRGNDLRSIRSSQNLKVKYLNTLREIVSKRVGKVSDYDLIDAEPHEHDEAFNKINL